MTHTADTLSPLADSIVGLYEGLAAYPASPVRIADLRGMLLCGEDQADVDAALLELSLIEGVMVWAQSDQANLTDADRAAAVQLGGEPRHSIAIEWAEIG